jgi:hypothetical protein
MVFLPASSQFPRRQAIFDRSLTFVHSTNIPRHHFKMESLKQICTMINQDNYLTSIDLADAFLQVLVNQSSRRFLQFAWKGHLF